MSVMEFREPNQVLWRGIRPGHNGTQVAKYGTANNETAVIHTVTAGKTFFLTHYSYNHYSTASNNNALLLVRNAADVLQYYIVYGLTEADAAKFCSGTFNPPLEIPAGYDICLTSPGVAVFVRAFIHGWEE